MYQLNELSAGGNLISHRALWVKLSKCTILLCLFTHNFTKITLYQAKIKYQAIISELIKVHQTNNVKLILEVNNWKTGEGFSLWYFMI